MKPWRKPCNANISQLLYFHVSHEGVSVVILKAAPDTCFLYSCIINNAYHKRFRPKELDIQVCLFFNAKAG